MILGWFNFRYANEELDSIAKAILPASRSILSQWRLHFFYQAKGP